MSENNAQTNKEVRKFRPATDIIELADGFHIYMDVPGLTKEQLHIDLQENEVTVSGATRDYEVEKENLTHREFVGGEYRRAFTISDNVDRERISAKLNNGVLELHLPKSEKALPRKIQIATN